LRRRLHYRPANLAGPEISVTVKTLKDALKLGGDVLELEVLFVELVVTILTKPQQAVFLSRPPLALNYHPDRVPASDRIMRHTRRQQKHLAFSNRDIDGLSVLLNFYRDIALKLIEKLLTLIPVIVFSRVRPADNHHNKIFSVVNTLIPNRRLEQMPVLIDPFLEVEGRAHMCTTR